MDFVEDESKARPIESSNGLNGGQWQVGEVKGKRLTFDGRLPPTAGTKQ